MPVYTNFLVLVGFWHASADWIYRLSGWEVSSVITLKRLHQWADAQLVAMKDSEKAPSISFLRIMAGGRMSEQSALSEAKEMLGPGTDTNSATLAHILYALSFNEALQADLVRDLEAAGWPTDTSALEAIPRLVAAVKEGIRWTGATAAMLPRIFPRGGYRLAGNRLAGNRLPGGIMIASSPIRYLRNEVAVPDPERYRSERWLTHEKNDATLLRDDYYIPFCKGAPTCIGNHFAYLELFLSVSQVLKRYSLHPREPSTVTVRDHEAVLPAREEWVAAVPVRRLEVVSGERR
ncbi:cytochrome P450 [Aspergillus homomorphus CBS 101889]|uniref:Cytochrome P450 n=1 Tax=Aspergillus homomorphus (strain CBS 101889) TaxID=1450537 RepID=A0A395HLE1_ASPHC|nr:cytochrome P450 [Aspergillus homomorphus CBS 101889]RAL08752.1 cytochrome P450 [Aspergillus homomorphus CBS 101889]